MIDGAGSAALMFVLLIALVLISRLRSVVGAEYRAEFNLIAGGIAVLSFCELLISLDQSSSLAGVPFLSNAIFHQLTVWIGIITGSILIVAGMARWMPVIRKLDRFQKRDTDSSIILRVVKLSQVEHCPNELFKSVFEMICQYNRIEQGIALSYSNSSGRFYPMVTLGGYAGQFVEQIEKIGTKYERAGKLKGHTVEILTGSKRFVHTFAVYAGGKLCGVYQIWGRDEKLSHGVIREIRTIGEIVGRAIDQSRLMLSTNHTALADSLRREVSDIDIPRDELIKYVNKLSVILNRYLACDYLSLSLLDESAGLERISVGCNGSILKENGLETTKYIEEAEKLFGANRAVLISDSSGCDLVDCSTVLVNSGMRAIMAIKLERHGEMIGVLLVASHEAMRYSRIELSLLGTLAAPVARRLIDECHRRKLAENLSFQNRLTELLTRIRNEAADDPYREVANLISDQFKVDLVRLSLLDETRLWLETETEVCKRSLGNQDGAPRAFKLSELPHHQQVIERGLAVEHSGPVSDPDQSFWFDNVCSTLVVPVVNAGGVAGTISIGHAGRLNIANEQIELLALVLGLAAEKTTSRKNAASKSGRGMIERINAERREQVLRSSLSGILGSIEMIKHNSPLDENKQKRFLEIIDRSARKLEQNLELTRQR